MELEENITCLCLWSNLKKYLHQV